MTAPITKRQFGVTVAVRNDVAQRHQDGSTPVKDRDGDGYVEINETSLDAWHAMLETSEAERTFGEQSGKVARQVAGGLSGLVGPAVMFGETGASTMLGPIAGVAVAVTAAMEYVAADPHGDPGEAAQAAATGAVAELGSLGVAWGAAAAAGAVFPPAAPVVAPLVGLGTKLAVDHFGKEPAVRALYGALEKLTNDGSAE